MQAGAIGEVLGTPKLHQTAHTLVMRCALAALTLLLATHTEAKPIVNVCSLFPKWTLDGSEPWGTGSGDVPVGS